MEGLFLIEVKNLTKKYGKTTAVDNISFNIEKGKIYGFLGPNGAGKSTTMNIITGCISATSGSVAINGHDMVTDSIAAKSLIGYLPEIPPLYPDMTPYEYLMFVAMAKGMDKLSASMQIRDVITLTSLEEVKDRLICNLSKGFRQRVGIAQAMLGSPEIIILDEPTVGLDPKQIIEIRELIRRLGQMKTIILSSHILAEIATLCDHVIIIHKGRLVANDTIDNLEGKMDNTQKLFLTVKGETKAVAKALAPIESIIEISQIPSESEKIIELELEILKDKNAEEDIFFALAKINTPIVRMTPHQPSLEDIFLSLTDETDFDDDENEIDFIPRENESEKASEEEEYKPLFSTKTKDEEDDK